MGLMTKLNKGSMMSFSLVMASTQIQCVDHPKVGFVSGLTVNLAKSWSTMKTEHKNGLLALRSKLQKH